MGQSGESTTAEMKAFLCLSLVAAASAAPQLLAGHHGVVGHGIAHTIAHAAPVVAHAAPIVHAAPVVHHAVAHPVAHAVAEVYPDEVSPYQYQYAVADDYSGSNFQAAETDDGTAARTGSYSVALPDGRTQHVEYTANDIEGYVATVTYDGQAVYPEAVPVAHAVAHPVAHAVRPIVHAAPVVHAGHGIATPLLG